CWYAMTHLTFQTVQRCSMTCSLNCARLMLSSFLFFFFNDTATTEIYTLSLHDALPIFCQKLTRWMRRSGLICLARSSRTGLDMSHILFMVEILLLRSEERRVGKECRCGWPAHRLKKKDR